MASWCRSALPASRSGLHTRGHRFLSEGKIEARRFDDYAQKLKAAHVVLEAEERAAIIFEGVKQAAFVHGLEMIPDEGLLAEVCGPGGMAGGLCRHHPGRVHGCAGGNPADLDAHASEVFLACAIPRPARWPTASPWSPTWWPRTAARKSSPATNACCAPACRTPSSSGTRTASTRWKAGSRS